jgi:copper chaperone CopZ
VTRLTLTVTGMSCRNCEHILSDRLVALTGVDAVNVDHAADELVVGDVERTAVEQAVAGAGYAVSE